MLLRSYDLIIFKVNILYIIPNRLFSKLKIKIQNESIKISKYQ
jgi:hypothetical protein